MKTLTVSIAIHEDRKLAVEAYPTISTALVVTRSIGCLRNAWTITHVGTGLAVMSFIRPKKRAYEVVERLLSLSIPWETITVDNVAMLTSMFKKELSEIRDFVMRG